MGNGIANVGSIGWILWLMVAILTIVSFIMTLEGAGDLVALAASFQSGTLFYIGLAVSVVTGVAALLSGFVIWVLGKASGHQLPSVAGITGLVSGTLTLAVIPLGSVIPNNLIFYMNLASLILIGVFFILVGASLVNEPVKNHSPSYGLRMATGILTIITGALYASVASSIIGAFMLVPTAIINLLVLGRK